MDEAAYASGNVSVTYEECDVITQRNLTFYDSLLPPWSGLHYFSGWTYDGADAGICAAGDRAARLYGAQRRVAQVLPVARSVSPPRIIGDDCHGSGAFADVVCIVFSVYGFIAYGASDRGLMPFDILDIEKCYLVLSDASAHHSAKHVVYRTEESRVWSVLDSHDKLALVEYFSTSASVNHQRRVVGFDPKPLSKVACCVRGRFL